jgi:hypothetical protein
VTPQTILVSGMMAGDPGHGGATWAVLQYVLGLRRLGHRVLFVEPVAPEAVRPRAAPLALSAQAAYFRAVARRFGVEGSSALLLAGTNETVGLQFDCLRKAARQCQILLNLAGMLVDERLTRTIPARVYVDLDPVFTQLWHSVEHIDMRFDGHTHFFTVGTKLSKSRIPKCGIDWNVTLPPVVLDHWKPASTPPLYGLTTVANWRSYGSIAHEGVQYGQRAHSFRRFFELPRLTRARFEPALAIHPGDRRDLVALKRAGWRLLDPRRVAATPASYGRFISGSSAELSIAKSGYVAGESGWFSDRSACYLASARPIAAQDTGFGELLPTGEGILTFKDLDGAVAAIETLQGDYARHARAARAVAVQYLDSGTVLTQLLEKAAP